MRRLLAGLVVAFAVLVVAVTPLSAVVQPGSFAILASEGGGVLRATLDDETRLVLGLRFGTDQPSPPGSPTRYLEVSWLGGCTNPMISMRFSAVAGGRYLLTEHTTGDFCDLLFGVDRSFILVLYTPLDPAHVEVVHA
jgi:hypothetical protein